VVPAPYFDAARVLDDVTVHDVAGGEQVLVVVPEPDQPLRSAGPFQASRL